MKWGLYLAGDVSRQRDPQLAYVYYRQMMYHGKTHNQAMGAVMSHLAARILVVRQERRPYELRDIDGKPITKKEARQLILSRYQVPEEIRRQRRRRNRPKTSASAVKKRGMVEHHKIREAASAPQLEAALPIPHNQVYFARLSKSTSSKPTGMVASVGKPRERRTGEPERSERESKSCRIRQTGEPDPET
jgi:hypothetical protein